VSRRYSGKSYRRIARGLSSGTSPTTVSRLARWSLLASRHTGTWQAPANRVITVADADKRFLIV
jgi:hypothetical protein